MNSSTEAKRVLVVDDDPEFCQLLGYILRTRGMRVFTAFDGKFAVDLMKSAPTPTFDLIILDLMMPKHSGYDVLKDLGECPQGKVPVVVMTAKIMDKSTLELIEMEPNVKKLWKKPFEIKDFLQGVDELTREQKAA